MFYLIREKKVIIISSIVLLAFAVSFLMFNNKEVVYAEDANILEEVIEEKEVSLISKFDIKGNVVNPGVYEFNENECIIDAINKAGGLTELADVSTINLSEKLQDEMVVNIYSKKEVIEYKKAINITPSSIIDSLTSAIESSINKLFDSKMDDAILISKKNALIESYSNKAIDEYSNASDIKLELTGKYIVSENNIDDSSTKIIEENNSISLININTASKEELMTLSGIGEARALDIIEYRSANLFGNILDIKKISGIGDSSFEALKDYITI